VIRRLLAAWRNERNLKRRKDGWDWAAGALLRGTPVELVLQHTEKARAFGVFDEFDRGAVQACEVWEKRK
jgi:hypothetical protein